MGRKSRNRAKRPAPPAHAAGAAAALARADVADAPPLAAKPISLAACAGVLLFVVATVWATPRVSGDTFVALAGGRDVFAGKVGKPDDWSFTTAGRVWLNQNWGFDALAYGASAVAGESGLLALKALLLLALAGAVAGAARTRAASWPATLVVTAAALAGARWHVELRANLATYLMAVVLVTIIYRCASRPATVWLAVPVLAVWANLHGGFLLGFGMLGWWAVGSALAAGRTGGWRSALRAARAPAAALVAGAVLAGVLTPYGVANVTYPFTYVSSPEWRRVTEWQPPSLGPSSGAASAWELALALVLIVGVAGWRLLSRRQGSGAGAAGADAGAARAVFEAGLVVAVAAMAASAARFVPLALLTLAPLAAFQAGALLRGRESWAAPAAAVALAAAMAPFAVRVAARYASENPRFTDESVFQRMTGADAMPYGATRFLADNGVAGRVFNDWRWEGFLRWRCPQLQLFMGGRATQIYSLETLHAYDDVTDGATPADGLAARAVGIAVVPSDLPPYPAVVDRLVYAPRARWTVVYYDGRATVLADAGSPATRGLAESVAGGSAHFRDDGVAALSRAVCRLAPALARRDDGAFDDLLAVVTRYPTAGGPGFLLYAARDRQLPPARLVAALQPLASAPGGESGRGRLGALEQQLSASQILAGLLRAAGHRADAERWAARTAELAEQINRVLADS